MQHFAKIETTNDPQLISSETLDYIQREILSEDPTEINEVRKSSSAIQARIQGMKGTAFEEELAKVKMLNAGRFPFYTSKSIPGYKIPLKQNPKNLSEWVADFSKVYADRKELYRQLKHLREEVLPELRVSHGMRNIFILENLDTNRAYVVSSVYYEYAEELLTQFFHTKYNKEVDAIKKDCNWNILLAGALSEDVEKGPIFYKIVEHIESKGTPCYNIRFRELAEA